MVPQEEKKAGNKGKKSVADTQEARILMYIVPVIAVLAILAFLFKQ